MPLVSVVMPAYNCEPFIEDSIQAVLDQNFSDFEFIIINDGSTDSTKAAIGRFSDPRIIFIENEFNAGIVETLNRGVSKATGKYILRTDADDKSMPGMIGDLVRYMESNDDCVACGGNMQLIGGSKIFSYPSEDTELKIYTLEACPFSHSTIIFRNSLLFEKQLYYDNKFKDAEDYALWSAMLPFGKFHNLDKVTLWYRESESQITAQKKYSENVKKARYAIYCFHAKTYFKLSDHEAVCYAKLILNEIPADYSGLKESGRIQEEVLKANRKLKLFDERKLKAMLFIKWHWLCEKYPSKNPILFLLYCKYLIKNGNVSRLPHVVSLLYGKFKKKRAI